MIQDTHLASPLVTLRDGDEISSPFVTSFWLYAGSTGKGLFQDEYAAAGNGQSWKFDSATGSIACGWTVERDMIGGLRWNATGTLGILVAGEVIGSEGPYSVRDFSALLSSYEDSGMSFIQGLNGAFCGVLVDLPREKCILFNDRCGLHPLYVHLSREGALFSTHAKTILRTQPQTRRFEVQSLGEWISCGAVLNGRSLFAGIETLPAGSNWSLYFDGSIQKKTYFSFDELRNVPTLSLDDFEEELQATFPRIVGRYTNDLGAVGMSLTGGLDGRLIMACLPATGCQIPTYTFNGPLRDCADVRLARKIAAQAGVSHTTINIDHAFFGEFPKLAEESIVSSDGLMDVTGSAEIYLNRKARRLAPVRLTGNYGSEVLRQHVAFRPSEQLAHVFKPEVASAVRNTTRTYSDALQGRKRIDFIVFNQVPWFHRARYTVERSQIRVRSPYLDLDLLRLAFRAPAECANNPNPLLRFVAHYSPALARIPTDRGLTWPSSQVRRVATGRYNEFIARVEYACDYGMPKPLAKINGLLGPLQPGRFFLGRQKFCHFASWYAKSKPMKDFVREILLSSNSFVHEICEPNVLRAEVAAHLEGMGNATLLVHKLLTIQLTRNMLLA